MKYLIICLLLTFPINSYSQPVMTDEDEAYNETLGQMQETLFSQHFDEFRAKYEHKFKKNDTATPEARERYVYYTFSMAEIDGLEGKNKEALDILTRLTKFKEFENWDDIPGNVAFDSLRKDNSTKSFISAAIQHLIADAKDEKDPQLVARLKILAARDRTNTQYNADDTGKYAAVQNNLTDSAISILGKYGYPGPSRVGEQASVIAHIISKAPQTVQKKYKTLFYNEGTKGNIPNGLAGVVLDKITVAETGKQVYGTQYQIVQGKIVFYPVAQPAGVEARRKKMGFKMTLKDYQKRTIDGR